MLPRIVLLAILAAPAWLAMSSSGFASYDPLAAMRGTKRILLVSSPNPDDPLLDVQRRGFAAMRAGAAERDLVLVEAVGPGRDAQAIRRRFAIEATGFEVLLIGKDGGEKLRSACPLGPDRLFPTIDAMPMRQNEMVHKP